MTETNRGAKAPRTHQKHWKDNTRNERQRKRRQQLNEIAQAAGFGSWSKYETAAINGEVTINQNDPR